MNKICQQICSALYIAEVLVRATAAGPRVYAGNNWNRFDIFASFMG